MSDEEIYNGEPPPEKTRDEALISGTEYYIEDIITRNNEYPKFSGRASGTFVGNITGSPLRNDEKEPDFLIFSDLKQVNERRKHGLDSYKSSIENLQDLKTSGDLDLRKTYYKFRSDFLIVLEKSFSDDDMEKVNQVKICAILAGKHWEEKNDKIISALPEIIMKDLDLDPKVYDMHNAKYKEKNPEEEAERAFLLEIKLQRIKQECSKLVKKKAEAEAYGKGGKSRKNKRVRKSRRSVSIKNRRKSRRK